MKRDDYDKISITDNELAKVYPLVRDFPEIPLNNAVLATGLGIDEQKAFPIFKALIHKGILVKKYLNINVYKLTQKGYQAVYNAYNKVVRVNKGNS
jgi:hypothetical protein